MIDKDLLLSINRGFGNKQIEWLENVLKQCKKSCLRSNNEVINAIIFTHVPIACKNGNARILA